MDAMRTFRNSGAHLKAMPKLLRMCDQASFTHFEQAGQDAPSPDAAYDVLLRDGKLSKVNAPSAEHLAGKTVGSTRPRVAQRWTRLNSRQD